MQEKLLVEAPNRLEIDRAGLRVTLSHGRPCMIRLAPDMMGRLLGVLSLNELQALATTIARAAESPHDSSTRCSRKDTVA